jgi:hypothetical protein
VDVDRADPRLAVDQSGVLTADLVTPPPIGWSLFHGHADVRARGSFPKCDHHCVTQDPSDKSGDNPPPQPATMLRFREFGFVRWIGYLSMLVGAGLMSASVWVPAIVCLVLGIVFIELDNSRRRARQGPEDRPS